ncbi:MAG: transferase hexapeptide repeat containing protein [Xanthomonadaceae bacterium]|nr:transferase hexapeptide repeat containing protein [Xanthomonadaceae bacterium]
MKDRNLIIVGDSAFAEVAYEYFTHDSPYRVVAFAVEREFLTKTQLFGVPVVCFEDLPDLYDPAVHDFYAALVYTQMNRLRTRLFECAKAKGYRPASYVSSRAFVWPNVVLGEHCFIFEDNTVQPFARIGSNVVLWSGNHIGHHSTIKDNCFISSHVVLSGFCTVGANCFIGVNATFGNNLEVGDDCLIGAGALIARDVPPDTLVKGNLATASPGVRKRFGLEDPT